MRNAHCRNWNMARKLTKKKNAKKKNLVGPGIWREKLKNEKHTL